MTIAKEVEDIANSRPLTYQGTDSQDISLSPSQLLWGRDSTLLPPLLLPDHPDDNSYYEAKAARHQYYLISSTLDHFRQRWVNEYFTALLVKHLNCCADNPNHHIKIGTLIMVRQSDLHRHEWPLGRI